MPESIDFVVAPEDDHEGGGNVRVLTTPPPQLESKLKDNQSWQKEIDDALEADRFNERAFGGDLTEQV